MEAGSELGVGLEKRALRTATALGSTAVPLLSRKLCADDERQSSWAYFLLTRVGGPRTVQAARDLAGDDRLSDGKKALALALLSELGAELPGDVRISDPRALRERSVRELVTSLESPADVARAADLLIDQVAAPELGAFFADIVDVAGAAIAPLIDELLLRDDTCAQARTDLDALRARLGATPPALASVLAPSRATVHSATRPDGARAVVVTAPCGSRGTRLRLLVLAIERDGTLGPATYDDELPRRALPRILAELAGEGFQIAPATVTWAAHVAAGAARATRAAHRAVPRAFYLGRDLCGLYDEHMLERSPAPPPVRPSLLDRGNALLDKGDAARARPPLERHVAAFPEDAEGRSCLGSCLLELGEHDAALRQFAIAARLEPADALRYWNLAHAAKRACKLGACYLALQQYLAAGDRAAGAAARLRSARRYQRLFERYAKLEHGDADPELVARGEELFDRAYAHLGAGRYQDAITGFQAVIQMVPSHYPSWGNLGAAFLAVRRTDDAERALRKALEYRPGYEVAVKNLAALREPT